MGVAGATNITLRAPKPNATVATWTGPAYCCVLKSISVGEDNVVIRSRVAKTLKINDGDKVEFYFEATGDSFELDVKVHDNICSDVLIQDFRGLGMAESIAMDMYGDTVVFVSGQKLFMPRQNMWAGMRVIKKQGSACLFFSGANRKRNDPRSPAGFAFRVVEGSDGTGDELVEGYGYASMDRSNNEMEYEGLIEALIWAYRLDVLSLTVCGDSELIINQLTGEYEIKNHRLKALHEKVHEMLTEHNDLDVEFKVISRNKNYITDNLAVRAIATKKSSITVNWPNVNKLMHDGT